jgi:hypothetical protein
MKGKCINLDCPEFNKVVDISDDEDFVCKNPECGHKLHEITDERGESFFSRFKFPLIIVVAVLVIGSIVTWWLLRPPSKPVSVESTTTEEKTTTVIPEDVSKTTPVSEQLAPNVEDKDSSKTTPANEQPAPDVKDKDTVYITQNTVIYKTDTVVKTEVGKEGGKPAGEPTKNYSFGKYEGRLKNGIPEGDGKMTYNRRVQIAKHDTKAHYAESGDYFDGSWGNGDIVSGYLYDKTGAIKERIFVSKRINAYDLAND